VKSSSEFVPGTNKYRIKTWCEMACWREQLKPLMRFELTTNRLRRAPIEERMDTYYNERTNKRTYESTNME